MDKVVEILCPASQVADAHGSGDAAAVYLAETFNLYAAGKGGKRVGGQIQA